MFIFIISLFLFWFITVFVTGDHRINVITAVLWSFVAIGATSIIITLSKMLYVDASPAVILGLSAVVQVLVLWYALRYRLHVNDNKQVTIILSSYVASLVVLGFIF